MSYKRERESPITESVNEIIRSFIGVRPRLLRQTLADLRQGLPQAYAAPYGREREQAAPSTLSPQALPLPQLPLIGMLREGRMPIRTTIKSLAEGLPALAQERWAPKPKPKQPTPEESAKAKAEEEARRLAEAKSKSSVEI